MSETTKTTKEITFVKKTCEVCGKEIESRTEKHLDYLYNAHMLKHKAE